MKSFIKPLLMLTLSIGIIIIAAVLPNALFGNSSGFANSYPAATDEQSPVGVMRGEYLARALGTNQSFEHNNGAEATAKERQAAVKAVLELMWAVGAPQYMLDEMNGLYDNASISTISIDTKNGARLPLIHLYLEWKGDWSNWIEVYVDVDSGKVLYFYTSGKCLANGEKYAVQYPNMPGPDEILEAYAKYCGYSAEQQTVSSNPNENALIVAYADANGRADYKINCIYYAGNMYDIKISPMEAVNSSSAFVSN
ncbi:MAG: hypothetical protein RSC86_00330 [Oscillospiraceae bacterium]